jgi:hypothetical protein
MTLAKPCTWGPLRLHRLPQLKSAAPPSGVWFAAVPSCAPPRHRPWRRLAYAELEGEVGSGPAADAPRQPKPPPPPRRLPSRALGVDYGRRLIGLAVSTMGLAPRPLPPIPGGRAGDVAELAKLVIQKAQSEGAKHWRQHWLPPALPLGPVLLLERASMPCGFKKWHVQAAAAS